MCEQVAQIDDLKAQMAEMRERLGLNSKNFSKPLSSDPPTHRLSTQREPTGRNRGGQPGQSGSDRNLKAVAQIDRVIDLRPADCSRCGALLLSDNPKPARHQVSDVPVTRTLITKYRRHTLKCLGYVAANQADWPAEAGRAVEEETLRQAKRGGVEIR